MKIVSSSLVLRLGGAKNLGKEQEKQLRTLGAIESYGAPAMRTIEVGIVGSPVSVGDEFLAAVLGQAGVVEPPSVCRDAAVDAHVRVLLRKPRRFRSRSGSTLNLHHGNDGSSGESGGGGGNRTGSLQEVAEKRRVSEPHISMGSKLLDSYSVRGPGGMRRLDVSCTTNLFADAPFKVALSSLPVGSLEQSRKEFDIIVHVVDVTEEVPRSQLEAVMVVAKNTRKPNKLIFVLENRGLPESPAVKRGIRVVSEFMAKWTEVMPVARVGSVGNENDMASFVEILRNLIKEVESRSRSDQDEQVARLISGCEQSFSVDLSDFRRLYECLVQRTPDIVVKDGMFASVILPRHVFHGDLDFVTKLDLSSNPMRTLPPAILLMPSLRKLDISWCSNLTDVPAGLAILTTLTELRLAGCDEITNIPAVLARLDGLRRLDVSYRKESSEIPESAFQLTQLCSLNMSWHKTMEEMPRGIANMAWLETLDLSHCEALKMLPPELCNVRRLKNLRLAKNYSLKALPTFFSNFVSLEALDLSGCTSLCELPLDFGRLANLQHLSLSGLSRITELPATFTMLHDLESLDLTGCSKLTSLPTSFGKLKSLHALILTRCKGLASLPDSFASIDALVYLDLVSCSHIRSLPPSLDTLSSLEELNLSENRRYDLLVKAISALTHLRKLDLSGIASMHHIPSEVWSLTNLESLNLSHNPNLSCIPPDISKLSKLVEIDLRLSPNAGQIPLRLAFNGKILRTINIY